MDTKRLTSWAIQIPNKSWFPWLALALITLLAAALRFFKLGEWSFWIDEIFTINRAQAHYRNWELILANIPPARNWIPLSVILTAQVLNLFGVSEWSARLVSAAIGIITIPILYFPMKKIFGYQVTLIALLLLAVSPWHIFWSQNARFYTSLMLFSTLALFAFYFGFEKDRPIYFIAFYLLFYLALSERMIAIFIVPVVAVYLVLLWFPQLEKPRGYKSKNILILSAPLITFIIYQLFLLITTGSYMFITDVDALAGPIDNPIRLLIIIVLSIGVPVTCFAFFSGIYLLRNIDRKYLFVFITGVLPLFILLLANPFVFTVERYVFFTLAFWLILASVGIKMIFLRVNKNELILGLGILLIFISDAAADNLMYFQINHGNRLDWQEAARYVQESMNNGDIVISTRADLASYYLEENVLEYRELLPDDLDNIKKDIWFIIDYPGIWHGNGLSKEWMEEKAELVKFSYLRVREENFLLVYHLETLSK